MVHDTHTRRRRTEEDCDLYLSNILATISWLQCRPTCMR